MSACKSNPEYSFGDAVAPDGLAQSHGRSMAGLKLLRIQDFILTYANPVAGVGSRAIRDRKSLWSWRFPSHMPWHFSGAGHNILSMRAKSSGYPRMDHVCHARAENSQKFAKGLRCRARINMSASSQLNMPSRKQALARTSCEQRRQSVMEEWHGRCSRGASKKGAAKIP